MFMMIVPTIVRKERHKCLLPVPSHMSLCVSRSARRALRGWRQKVSRSSILSLSRDRLPFWRTSDSCLSLDAYQSPRATLPTDTSRVKTGIASAWPIAL